MIRLPADPTQRWAALQRHVDLTLLIVPPPTFGSRIETKPYLTAVREIVAEHATRADAPLQLYLHVPLCEERCTFCMYHYSLTDARARRVTGFSADLRELLTEMSRDADPLPAAALYVGGGTPSVLDVAQIDEFLAAVTTLFPLEKHAGATFEMSPRSASADKIAAAARHGINRFSFGVQTFDDGLLRTIHRQPTHVDVLGGLLKAAFDAGAHDVNVDLMVGLIGQTTDRLVADVATLARLEVPSITLYRYRPVAGVPDPVGGDTAEGYVDRCVTMVAAAAEAAALHGYERSPQLDAESVRLFRTEHRNRRPFLPERGWYRTQYRMDLDNTLLGLGGGSLSLSRARYFRCPHIAEFGGGLLDRSVDVVVSEPFEQAAMALVRELYWTRRIDYADVDRRFGVRTDELLGAELDLLAERGVVRRAGTAIEVAASPGDWLRAEKLLYPVAWLEPRLSERSA